MAQNPQLLIRIAANIEELKRNLAQGKLSVETTTAAMTKLAASLDGSRLEQRAHNITAAINSIGGATKLTDAEAKRHLVTLDAWIQKAGRMGKEIPPAILSTRDALKKVSDEAQRPPGLFDKIGSAAKTMAGVLGVTFSIGALVSFGRTLVGMADDIKRFADRTGLTTDEVQRLQHVAEQTGTSVDGMMMAVSRLAQRLGDGDTGAAGSMKELGLKTQDFLSLNPYQQMLTVSEGMKKFTNEADFARVANGLFGRSWMDLKPALVGGMKEIADGAPVMSDKTVQALDRMDDAWAKTTRQIKVWAADAYLWIGKQLDQVVAEFYDKIGGLYSLMGQVSGLVAKVLPGLSGMKAEGLSAAAKETARWFHESAKALRAQGDAAAVASPKMAAFVGSAETGAKAAAAALKVLEAQYKANLAEAKKQEEAYNKQKAAILKYNDVMRDTDTLLTKLSRANDKLGFTQYQLRGELHDGAATWLRYQEILDGVNKPLSALPGTLIAITKEVPKLAATLKDNLLTTLQSIPQTLASAFTGGGGIMGGIKSIASTIGSQIGSSIGLAVGGPMGASIGAALGSLAGKLTDFLKPLWGALTEMSTKWKVLLTALIPPLGIATLFSNPGRDAVKDFAETFGGFDAMHAKLLELGDAGEQLWIKLTQGVGRNNAKQAAQVIAEVEEALAKQKAAQDTATVSTEAGAQATIETATQAALALDELNAKLGTNADAWGAWSEDVTGFLQKLANDIRSLPMPGPGGGYIPAPQIPGGSGRTGGGVTRTSPSQAGGGDININATLLMPDGDVLLRQVVKAQKGLG